MSKETRRYNQVFFYWPVLCVCIIILGGIRMKYVVKQAALSFEREILIKTVMFA